MNAPRTETSTKSLDPHIRDTAIFVGNHIDQGLPVWQLRPKLGLFLSDHDLQKLVNSYLADYRQLTKPNG